MPAPTIRPAAGGNTRPAHEEGAGKPIVRHCRTKPGPRTTVVAVVLPRSLRRGNCPGNGNVRSGKQVRVCKCRSLNTNESGVHSR